MMSEETTGATSPEIRGGPSRRSKVLLGSGALALVAALVGFTAIKPGGHSHARSSVMMNMPGSDAKPAGPAAVTPAIRRTFSLLSAAHTDACDHMGDKAGIDREMNAMAADSRLQGACCAPMNLANYTRQTTALKKYADILEIPPDPYDVPVASARQMLGFYDTINLNTAQQAVFSDAQSHTEDRGWCCCQCWVWYTHAGLARFLIARHNFSSAQVVEVTNLEDCCGGGASS